VRIDVHDVGVSESDDAATEREADRMVSADRHQK
jgi:hypothetical protein